jgi:hypothetical protein
VRALDPPPPPDCARPCTRAAGGGLDTSSRAVNSPRCRRVHGTPVARRRRRRSERRSAAGGPVSPRLRRARVASSSRPGYRQPPGHRRRPGQGGRALPGVPCSRCHAAPWHAAPSTGAASTGAAWTGAARIAGSAGPRTRGLSLAGGSTEACVRWSGAWQTHPHQVLAPAASAVAHRGASPAARAGSIGRSTPARIRDWTDHRSLGPCGPAGSRQPGKPPHARERSTTWPRAS